MGRKRKIVKKEEFYSEIPTNEYETGMPNYEQ
jgi:hypothetical protein